jgi:hypothetical protein
MIGTYLLLWIQICFFFFISIAYLLLLHSYYYIIITIVYNNKNAIIISNGIIGLSEVSSEKMRDIFLKTGHLYEKIVIFKITCVACR